MSGVDCEGCVGWGDEWVGMVGVGGSGGLDKVVGWIGWMACEGGVMKILFLKISSISIISSNSRMIDFFM